MAAHPHAENMRLYAEDAAETDKPWERWESRKPDSSNELYRNWSPVNVGDMTFPVNWEFRRKPKPLELWVNIYSDGRRINHANQKRAISAANDDQTNSLLRAAVHMREVTE